MTKRRSLIGFALLSTFGVACASFAMGPQRTETAREAPQSSTKTLMVDVDVVLINATVTAPGGEFVTGLDKDHFRVWEDKIEQEVTYFSSEDVAASIGIIFDISGSMKDKISGAHEAATTFLKGGNPDDEYFLVEFSERPQITENFTSDIRKLQNHLMSTKPKGMTSLYDAVYLGLNKLKEGANPRKALLVITDGEDNHSRYTFSEIREFAKEQDVQIFAIGIIGDWNSQLNPGAPGRAAIDEIVSITGGHAFYPDNLLDLQKDCAKIALELKNQYVLGYRSTNESKDGKFRKVKVEVVPPKSADFPKLGIRSKNGYYGAK